MALLVVQGDTAPDLNSALTVTETGTPVDLTSASVRFQMRKPDDRRFTVNAAAFVVDDSNGLVRYSWGVNDLAVPGTYQIQWEVTYPGGRVQTTAEPEDLTVRRQ